MLFMVKLPNIITCNKYNLQHYKAFMSQVVWELSGFTEFLSHLYFVE